MRHAQLFAAALTVAACSGSGETQPAGGEVVTPPFDVSGEADGLLLVWFDEEGPHTATRRSEIPEDHREAVRVDDLSLPPDVGLDPDEVYVADLRNAGAAGHYTVRRLSREAFDRQVEEASAVARAAPTAGDPAAADPAAAGPPSAPSDGPADADVIIYGASWCSACRSTAAFLRRRGIPFVERDIERDAGAREAMLRAARGAGVSPRGIPVIDFRGRIIAGFDQRALERAIEETAAPI